MARELDWEKINTQNREHRHALKEKAEGASGISGISRWEKGQEICSVCKQTKPKGESNSNNYGDPHFGCRQILSQEIIEREKEWKGSKFQQKLNALVKRVNKSLDTL